MIQETMASDFGLESQFSKPTPTTFFPRFYLPRQQAFFCLRRRSVYFTSKLYTDEVQQNPSEIFDSGFYSESYRSLAIFTSHGADASTLGYRWAT